MRLNIFLYIYDLLLQRMEVRNYKAKFRISAKVETNLDQTLPHL